MSANPIVNYTVAVGDPEAPAHVIKPHADGSIDVNGISVTIAGVTVADGADVAEGAKADDAVTLPTGNATVVALLKGLVGLRGRTYNTVAGNVTAQVLTGGGGGATGDYLNGLLVTPASTSPGNITILDGNTSIPVFVGGASSLSNTVPFTIPVEAKSASGAWKVTTGTSITVIASGQFT